MSNFTRENFKIQIKRGNTKVGSAKIHTFRILIGGSRVNTFGFKCALFRFTYEFNLDIYVGKKTYQL